MKSNQSKQTKPSSKDSEIEEVNHLDNDKELREQVLDILRFPNNKKPERFTIATQIRNKQSEDLLEIIDQYTQSKLKAFAGEVEEAIPTKGIVQDDEDLEDEFTGKQLKHELQENNINFGKNDAIDSFVEALKAIKEKYQL